MISFCRTPSLLTLAATLLLVWPALPAAAHPLDVTYSSITVGGEKVRLETNLTARQVAVMFLGRENNFVAADVLFVEDRLVTYLNEHVLITAQACERTSATLQYERTSTTQLLLNGLHYEAEYGCPEPAQRLGIINTLFVADFPDQRNIMVFSDEATAPQQVFTLEKTQGELDVATTTFNFKGSAPVQESLFASVWRFIGLGFEHVLIGYDHIAFIIGVHLVVRKLRDILKIVTSFTIAHSITLTLATLGIVQLPSALVEAAIAATIVYIGVENLVRTQWRGRWQITFGLGLIHGLGFSSVLRGIGIPQQFIIPDLIGFNVGVELGQITIVAFLLPLLLLASKWPRLNSAVVYIGSIAVSIAGLVWFLQRIAVL